MRLWQPTIGRLVRFAKLSSEPLALTWTADGSRLLAGCADGRLHLVDPDTAEVLGEQSAVEGWLYTLAVLPSGRALLAGGERGQLRAVEPPAEQRR